MKILQKSLINSSFFFIISARSENMKKNEEKKKIVKEVHEFREFISRGNVIDMAVGVIIGSAFGKIITSLVNDVLMPIIGVFLGGLDFSNLSIKINDANIAYGSFIQSVVDFFIISVCIFTMIKMITKLQHKPKAEDKKETPVKSDEVLLLEEIRDLLKKKK